MAVILFLSSELCHGGGTVGTASVLTGVLISPQLDQGGIKFGSMSGTRAISTTSRRELSLSIFFFLQDKALREINAFLTEIFACSLPGRAEEFMCVRSTLFLNDQPTRPNTPQHSNLHQHCCEKLKPNLYYIGFHSKERWGVGSEREKKTVKKLHSVLPLAFKRKIFPRRELRSSGLLRSE